MGVYRVNGPNGEVYEVTAPDGASQADIVAYAQAHAAETQVKGDGVKANIGAGLVEGATGAVGDMADRVNPANLVLGGLRTAVNVADAVRALATGGNVAEPLKRLRGDTQVSGPTPHALNRTVEAATGYNPENVVAATPAERISRSGAAALPGVALPAGEGYSAAQALKMLPEALLSGLGAGSAAEVAPDDVKDIAAAAGGLVAPAGRAGVVAASNLPRGRVGDVAARVAAAVSPAVAEREAGRTIANAASDPAAVQQSLAENGELVPGSQPTTYQQTGDQGLGQLERVHENANRDQFNQRRADQNAARVDTVKGVQQGDDPNDVATFLKAQFDDLDAQTHADVGQAVTKAHANHEAETAKAQAAYDAADAQSQAAVDAAGGRARQSTAGVGGAGTPEAYGETIRNAVDQAHEVAKERNRTFWRALDPNRDLIGNTSDTVNAAHDIEGSVSSTAKPMDGEEVAIFQAAKAMPKLAPVSDLIDLRTRVSTEMRNVRNADPQSYRRLTMLRGAIEDNLSTSIAHQIAVEDAAVARGTMAGEDTTLERLRAWQDEWRANRGAAGGGQDTDVVARSRSPGDPGRYGAGLSQARGPEGAAGDQGISGGDRPQGLTQPTFTEADKQKLDEATADTKRIKQTYGVEPIRTILRDSGTKGQFTLPDGRVPEKLFRPGPAAFDAIQKAVQAAGEQIIPALVDYAALSLRRAAEQPNGALDPVKFTRWRINHADALRALPADARARFANAAAAGKALRDAEAARGATLKDAEAARRAAVKGSEAARDKVIHTAEKTRAETLKDAQSGALGRVMRLSEPQDVVRTIGQILNGTTPVAQMKQLALATRRDPAARGGLRQAVADHITQALIGNTEAAASGVTLLKADAYQTFMRKAEPALNLIFTPSEVSALKGVAADLQRAARSQNTQTPGRPSTAADLAAIQKSPLAKHGGTLLHALVGGGAAAAHNPIAAVVGILGVGAVQVLHANGVKRIDQLVTEAMLHPQVARRLLAKAPPPGATSAREALGMGIASAIAKANASAISSQYAPGGSN